MLSRRTHQNELLGSGRCGHSTFDFLRKVRASLMLIYGEFETFVRLFECFGLLINGGFIAMEFIL